MAEIHYLKKIQVKNFKNKRDISNLVILFRVEQTRMRAKRASEFRAVEASAASETAQRNEYIQNTGDNFLPQIMCKLNEGPKMGITYAIYWEIAFWGVW